MDLITAPDAAIAVPPAPVAHVVIHCGQNAVDLTGVSPDVQLATVMAVVKMVDVQSYLNLMHERAPHLLDAAAKLMVMCGVS